MNHENQRSPLSGEGIGESSHVLFQNTVITEELNVSTVDLDTASSLAVKVLIATEGSETPVLGNDNLLATRELVLRSAEGLQSESTV